jgi:type IV fimbrial biogenesis protein FimT
MKYFRQRAMTLLELLATMLLIMITAAYAVPSFSQLTETNRQRALQEKLLYHLQSARSRAVLQGKRLEICGSTDGQQCNSAWNAGWILRVANTEEVIASETLNQQKATLYWRGPRDSVLFRHDGQTPLSNGRFYLCHDGKVVWQLVINRQGRIRHTSATENRTDAYRCS